jgi:hypothetical protein
VSTFDVPLLLIGEDFLLTRDFFSIATVISPSSYLTAYATANSKQLAKVQPDPLKNYNHLITSDIRTN